MNKEHALLHKTIARALTGKDSHVQVPKIFEGLEWKTAGAQVAGSPHTAFQLLNHMMYWQEWAINWMEGGKPPVPKHADGGWPGSSGPANAKEWEQAVRRFHGGLDTLNKQSRGAELLTKKGKHTRLEMLHLIAAHNSYHSGQVALLRQILGAWPPPSGGVTW